MPIFRQYREIDKGLKTETRRVVKDGDELIDGAIVRNGRILYQVGKDYPVIPKRAARRVMVKEIPHSRQYSPLVSGLWEIYIGDDWYQRMLNNDWLELRVKYLSIRKEPLQELSENGAIAEGVNSVSEYIKLWQSLNDYPGIRWSANPMVYVMEFERLYISKDGVWCWHCKNTGQMEWINGQKHSCIWCQVP